MNSDAVSEYFAVLTSVTGWGIMFFGAWRLYRRSKEFPWDQSEFDKAWLDAEDWVYDPGWCSVPGNIYYEGDPEYERFDILYQEGNPFMDPSYSWMPGNIFYHDDDDKF